jgi:hypothetical protein
MAMGAPMLQTAWPTMKEIVLLALIPSTGMGVTFWNS